MYEHDLQDFQDGGFPMDGGEDSEDDEDPEYIRYRNYKRNGGSFEAKYGEHKESLGQKAKSFLPSFLRS